MNRSRVRFPEAALAPPRTPDAHRPTGSHAPTGTEARTPGLLLVAGRTCRTKETTMSKTVRWGILGTGGIARAFATDLNAVGLTIAAVGSRSQESADRFAAEFGIPTAYPSYE